MALPSGKRVGSIKPILHRHCAGAGVGRVRDQPHGSYVLPAVYSQSDPEDWVAGPGPSPTTFGENADPTPPELLRATSAPWSQDRTRLSLTLEARDLESGIRRFEVAIGTSRVGNRCVPGLR